jgi:hypothetical protein
LKHTLKATLLFFTPILFWSANSLAAKTLINATPPSFQHVLGDTGFNIFYPATTTPPSLDSQAFYNGTYGYQLVTDQNTGIVSVDVSTDATFRVTGNQKVVVTLSISTSSGSEIPLTGAALATSDSTAPALCNSGSTATCQTASRSSVLVPISAYYTPGTVIRLSFSLADLCSTTGVSVSTGSGTICKTSGTSPTVNLMGAGGGSGVTNTQLIYATFSIVDSTTNIAGAVASGTNAYQASTTLGLTDVPPTIACPSTGKIEDFYYPGDQSVLINAGNYATGINGGASLQSILVLAKLGSSVPALSSNSVSAVGADVSAYINYTGDRQIATGFTNTSSTSPLNNGYAASFYAMNSAGIFSYGNACNTGVFPLGQGAVSSDGLLHAEGVNSVLTESKCFIATAAFHDGKAGPVMMLRKFRDQVLSKYSLGRDFISTYYTYSPALAEWAWDKPIIRSVALHALAPVEFMAWAILKLTPAEEINSDSTPQAAPSSQPYIDRIKKKLDEEDASEHHEVGDSYTETLKKRLDAEPTPSSSYIDRIKKTLPAEEDSSIGYADRLKKDLPPEDEVDSPIAKVKEGRDHINEPKRPTIKSAVSVSFGVVPGVKVENSAGIVKFQDEYGGPFQPDLWIRYERQLFHSENFGSFGIGGELGVSYAEGYGQYQFAFGSLNSRQSRTKFSFLQIPVLVNAIYRFNLLRILRPYGGVGVGALGYSEIRTDGIPSKRGYSMIYDGRVGVSLLLDFLDSKTSRDGYLSTGIQHTYLFAEYMYLNSFNKTGVTFGRSGVYAGFLFEF